MTAARGTEADRLGVTGGTAGRLRELLKTPTGISGLDEVTGGGLPPGLATFTGSGFLTQVSITAGLFWRF